MYSTLQLALRNGLMSATVWPSPLKTSGDILSKFLCHTKSNTGEWHRWMRILLCHKLGPFAHQSKDTFPDTDRYQYCSNFNVQNFADWVHSGTIIEWIWGAIYILFNIKLKYFLYMCSIMWKFFIWFMYASPCIVKFMADLTDIRKRVKNYA